MKQKKRENLLRNLHRRMFFFIYDVIMKHFFYKRSANHYSLSLSRSLSLTRSLALSLSRSLANNSHLKKEIAKNFDRVSSVYFEGTSRSQPTVCKCVNITVNVFCYFFFHYAMRNAYYLFFSSHGSG